MKYYELDKEEREILGAYEEGKLLPMAAKDKAIFERRLRLYVRQSLKKAKNINIRLSEQDLVRIKAKALEDAIPYQTYIASVLHKHIVRR